LLLLYIFETYHNKAIFVTGEEELESITRELEKDSQTDGRYKYYADGVLRVNNVEVLIMEASSAYDKVANIKFSFDYYKGMFGALSIMKHIASKYKYASFDTFKALKIHFIHAFGKNKKIKNTKYKKKTHAHIRHIFKAGLLIVIS
jgi:hypothetical protein